MIDDEVAVIAAACDCDCRDRKGPPTNPKWWWLPVIAVWLYIVYRVTCKVLP